MVKGEAEQLLWKLDEALSRPGAVVQLGTLEDLDRLPMPDWSPFGPESFRIGYDFTRFPTGLVQSSRGCTLKCDYCPYIVLENSTRVRSPEAVADEMAQGIRRWGFRSFKFRDPLFGLRRTAVFDLAERIGRLPRKIQFSIETRIDLLPAETLRMLRRVGLTSITVGVETSGRRPVAPLSPRPDPRGPPAGVHPAVPQPGHSHRGRLPHRLSRRHRGVDPTRASTTPRTSIRRTPISTW